MTHNCLAVLLSTQSMAASLGLDGIMGAGFSNHQSFDGVGFFSLQAIVAVTIPDKVRMGRLHMKW